MSNEMSIKLNYIKPVSINKAYYKNGNLTTLSRQFRYKFLKGLLDYQDQLKQFKKAFDETRHIIGLNIIIETPEELFFTKSSPRKISNRAGDAGNYEKLITDFLTNPKYCTDKYVHESMVNVGIDDRFVKSLTIDQMPVEGNDWNIAIYLELIEFEEMYPWMF